MARKTVVLATWGSFGDLHPFIAVALALKARGLRPVIATSPDYRRKIEDEGLVFHPVRPGFEQLERDTGLTRAGFLQAIAERPAQYLIETAVLPYLAEACEDLMAAALDADLVVASSLSIAAMMAAEGLGKPTIGVHLSPMLLMSREDPPMFVEAPFLPAVGRLFGSAAVDLFYGLARLRMRGIHGRINAARTAAGLPPVGGNAWMDSPFRADEVVALYSPLLGGAPAHPAKPTLLAGFAFFDRDGPDEGRLSPDIERFLSQGEAPLVFTLGSAFVLNGRQFYETSAETTRSLGRRALLLVGRDSEASLAAALSAPDIMVAGYAPHSLIFPRAAACIHHGGIGTTAQALRAAAPQLVCPIFADQADNAMRAERLGVARVLPYREYTHRRVVRQLGALLSDPEVRPKARTTAEFMAGEDGARTLADRIATRLKSDVAA
jgi:UDP:flavonoid glycosyltransferase YjiC (YdhE family)